MKLHAMASSDGERDLPLAQELVALDIGRMGEQPERADAEQRHVAGIEPDGGREVCKAADHDGGEGHAGDEQEIDEPPAEIAAPERFRLGAHLDARQPAQPQHQEAQHIGQELRHQVVEAAQQLAGVTGMKVLGQAQIEHKERHGDAEDGIAQGIETHSRIHGWLPKTRMAVPLPDLQGEAVHMARRLFSFSPFLRGEGRDEGLFARVRTPRKNGERETRAP